MMGSTYGTLAPSMGPVVFCHPTRHPLARKGLQPMRLVRPAAPQPLQPRAATPPLPKHRHGSVPCLGPATACAPTSDAEADPKHMVWTLARLPLGQGVRTFAVALGKLASEAGTTYTTIIGAKLLVSRRLRFEDALLTVGLTMGGNLLQLLEAHWETELERHFQATMVPWLAKRRAHDIPHDVATFEALGKLVLERSTQWVDAAGLLGRLGSSLYAALGNSHQVPRALLGAMVGLAVMRHGLGAWWAQHIQQRLTDWTLEQRRATFALLRGAGSEAPTDIATNETRLARNRALRLDLKRKSIGIESVQEALLLASCYGAFWRLGWFAPQQSLDALVALQAGMSAAQSLVASILMVPLFVIGQAQMHTRVGTYLRAKAA